MTKLLVAFRSFPRAPKKIQKNLSPGMETDPIFITHLTVSARLRVCQCPDSVVDTNTADTNCSMLIKIAITERLQPCVKQKQEKCHSVKGF
jgi:hypothetical protein